MNNNIIRNINLLPAKYQSLNTIVSAEYRSALCDTLVSINGLLNTLHGQKADPQVVKLVTRYFSYLDRSCVSPSILNNRACWLGTYAKVLEYRLQTVVNRIVEKPSPLSVSTDTHFIDKLTLFGEAISTYRTNAVNNDPECDRDILEVLGKLIELSSQLSPNHDNRNYQHLVVLVDNLTTNLTKRAATSHVGAYDSNLLMRLMELHYVVSQYRVF